MLSQMLLRNHTITALKPLPLSIIWCCCCTALYEQDQIDTQLTLNIQHSAGDRRCLNLLQPQTKIGLEEKINYFKEPLLVL